MGVTIILLGSQHLVSLEEESEIYLEGNKEVVDWERPFGAFQLFKPSAVTSPAILSVAAMGSSSENTFYSLVLLYIEYFSLVSQIP